MAIMLGGAAFHAAQKLKTRMLAIAAHDLGIAPSAPPMTTATCSTGPRRRAGAAGPSSSPSRTATSTFAARHASPGLAFSHVMQVPTGGDLPTADGRVQMYPCFSFEFHLVLVAIDPDLGKPEIKRYFVGHDCGTVINPKIVRGMTMGGIAHGIGAALYEEFAYNDEGQLVAQSFMDYLLPSAHEVPPVEIVHHETPSPHTVLRPEGLGRIRLSRRAGGDRERGQRRACIRSAS